MELKGGSEITRELAAGEVHEGHLALEKDQLVQAVVHQQGVDVAVELYDPVGELVLKVDSPNGRQGPERILAVAEEVGIYRMLVRAVERDAPAGKYRLVVGEPRRASADEQRRAEAEKLFSEAEELRRKGSPESRRQAVEHYQEVRARWRELGERMREADALLRLGWVYRDLRERAGAAAFLTEARVLYRELGEGHGEVLSLNSLASMWIRLREYHAALPLIQEALEIARDIGLTYRMADCLNNLGIVRRRLGKTGRALTAYMEALKLYKEVGEPPARARIRTNIGVLLTESGKLPEAADQLEAAVEILSTLDEPVGTARSLSRLGDVRRRQGRLEQALDLLVRALELRHRAEDQKGQATTFNGIGTTQLLLGSREQAEALHEQAGDWFEQAKASYEQARQIFHELGDTREEAVTLLNLGRLHAVMGEPGLALGFHREAAPLIEHSEDRLAKASNVYGMARALHDLEDFQAALQHLEETLEKVEELRTETTSEGLRIAFFASRQHYYELHIDVLMHLHEAEPDAGHDTVAFSVAERRRARALLEALGEDTAEIRRHADPQLLEEEATLQAELNELEQSRTALLLLPDSEQKIDDITKNQREKSLALEHVRGRLRAELTQPQPCSLADTKYLLRDATLLLAYSLGEERSFLWSVSQAEVDSYVLPGRQQIETMALEAQKILVSQSENSETQRQELLAELSRTLLADVAAKLDGQRLAIVVEGALLYLPFAVLPGPDGMKNSTNHLVERHEIVYLPSVSVLRKMRQQLRKRHPAPRQLAVFADPVFSRGDSTAGTPLGSLRSAMRVSGVAQLRSLPHTREEAEEICKIARGETMAALGFEATKQKILDGHLEEYQILHFATHGLTNRAQPDLSGLVLSLFDEHGEHRDGFLRLHEIYGLHLPAELAVLSACQTGVGLEVRGEGFLGLTRGFMYAGTPRLVVSLWNVADRATAELMKRFYWNLLEAQTPPAQALRAAQVAMLESREWRHPTYWAGFVFQGEWWPPGEEPPIEENIGGAEDDDESPIGYPGPDRTWCESLPEAWMKRLCHTLRRLGGRDDA